MKINLLPEEERPRERALSMGIGKLSDYELLALIIRTGDEKLSAQELAGLLTDEIGGGLRGISNASIPELMDIKGIGKSKACAISAAFELGRRVNSRPPEQKERIYSASDVARLFMADLRGEKREHFRLVMLDSKAGIMAVEEISIGELTAAPVHPREAFSPAVKRSAASVVFVHNHPSGDPTPSGADLETTKLLCSAGKILGIRVLDHVIIGDGEYSSIREMGYLD